MPELLLVAENEADSDALLDGDELPDAVGEGELEDVALEEAVADGELLLVGVAVWLCVGVLVLE